MHACWLALPGGPSPAYLNLLRQRGIVLIGGIKPALVKVAGRRASRNRSLPLPPAAAASLLR